MRILLIFLIVSSLCSVVSAHELINKFSDIYRLIQKSRVRLTENEEKILTQFSNGHKEEFESLKVFESEHFLELNSIRTPKEGSTLQEGIDYYTFCIQHPEYLNLEKEDIPEYIQIFDKQRSELIRQSTLRPIRRTILVEEPIQQPTLFVTHASRSYDRCAKAQSGIDAILEEIKTLSRDARVIFLMSPGGEREDVQWYTCHREPHIAVDSESGEHSISITHNEVTIVGGYYGKCHLQTVLSTLKHYKGSFPLTVHFPRRAIFTQERGSAAAKTLETPLDRSHLEGLVNKLDLKTFVPNYSSYTFEIRQDHVKVLEQGRGANKVILDFETQ